ncbi:MAG: hypothetical protein JNM17_21720 [Archangium sp.]|nr:hypothetical protein [Archangium sp.]
MSDAPDQPGAAAPAAPAPEANANGTAYEQVQKLKADGKTREEILTVLKGQGHDDEAAKVLVNSVMGAMPAELPSAQLSPGTNALAPSVFSLSDIGLTGPSHVIGLYWIGFGAAILLALGIASVMNMAGFAKVPDDVAYYGLRLGGVLSMTCVAWGVFRYSQAIVIRRK